MTLWQLAVTGWLGASVVFLGVLLAHDMWLTHASRQRARGFLAADRADMYGQWQRVWENAYARDELEVWADLPAFDPEAHA